MDDYEYDEDDEDGSDDDDNADDDDEYDLNLEHALLNFMQSVKVEEKDSNMVQLFTSDFHLVLKMRMMIIR